MSNKLELTWVGKNDEINVEPRLLVEDKEKSNCVNDPSTENMIIHGDNLLALKALENKYSGQIKCIYIDPPYNTGSAFEHYDDNLEHSIWLDLMRRRLISLRTLLKNDGFIACHIDDSEGAYLKILMDEVFGRNNYETTIYVRVRYPEKTLKQDMNYHKEIEQIHVYRKSSESIPNFMTELVGYEKFKYYIREISAGVKTELGGKTVEIFTEEQYEVVSGEGSEEGLKEIWASGTILDGNSSGRFFRDYLTGRVETDGLGVLYKVWGIGDDKFDYRYFTGPKRKGATKGKYYQGVPIDKLEANQMTRKVPINNFYDLAASFGNCRTEGGVGFRGGKKPEKLLHIILTLFSNEGDLVLDSFLGSASTIATAQKMKRRYIGIEMGEHAYSLCKVRLDRVIAGDKTGISKEIGWQGGGAYKFYELAPTLINKDDFDEYVINHEYDADMLASAVALHEGFIFQPNKEVFWKQSVGSENSYLFVTTRHIDASYIDSIQSTMEDDEFLIIACRSYSKDVEKRYLNIVIKKIPQMLLNRCEFNKENYNLNIINPPIYDYDEEEENEY
ncbi:adenine specific DNA methylase Mod [Streptococcus milleri]|uniref:site-specific DNA-methyltransferase n=1 Tax=Streptococcus milleri TaxID=33040 RepID=UPI000F6C81CD|nr:site-specific DNA-methyltransferase [Streptococcus milleri]VEE83469.1 adenine specific DNA methylase Mod [Streptococcus milleri]